MGWLKRWFRRRRSERSQKWLSDSVSYHLQRGRSEDRPAEPQSSSEDPPDESEDELIDTNRLSQDDESDSGVGLSQGNADR